MASWEFPDNESSLLHAAKFQADGPSLDKIAARAQERAGELAEAGPEAQALGAIEGALEGAADDTGSMDLWFQNGRVYTFFNVPRAVYRGLLSASSPGSYYNSNIRGNYAA
jgi:hypothetical protein